MSKHNEQDCGFEQAYHQQQIQQVPTRRSDIFGQANPIYAKKNDQNNIDYDGAIMLKMLPILNFNQIQSYSGFRFGAGGRKQVKTEKQKKQDKQPEDQNSSIVKIKNLGTHQNAFNKYYQKCDIIYCKFKNTKYNIYKDVTYFAGIFVPREVLSNKIKNSMRDQKIVANIGTILNLKNGNKSMIAPNNRGQNNNNNNAAQRAKSRGHLCFDSNFQSGNLFVVFRTDKYSYDLVLNNDINSKGSTQWFFFSVQGIQPNIDYTFNIVNFTKNDSLFNYGMRPTIYSIYENNGISPFDANCEEAKIGWYRYGKNVQYYRGQIQRENSMKYYYTLSFTVNWKFAGDKLYISHSYPYTYTRNVNFMRRIVQKSNRNQQQRGIIRRNKNQKPTNYIEPVKIGKTIGGKQLISYLISSKKNNKSQSKQVILIMARQHPGQTQGSFVCEGVVKQLVQNTGKEVKFLLENYQVYVIPMVNPDGVIFGNYRTNLSGKDLNRKWDSQGSNFSVTLTPQVVAVKQFLSGLAKTGMSIRFVLDLHGHSKKLNSFFYGNPNPDNPEQAKIFPYICSRYSEAIQFMDCTFASEPNKKKAARIYLSTLYQQLHVYTFESSFYGYKNRQGKLIQFTPQQYEKVGQVLIKSLYLLLFKQKNQILTQTPQSLKVYQESPQTKQSIDTYKKFQTELKQNQLLLKIGDAQSSGSQSKPQEGQLNNEDIVYNSEDQQEADDRVIVSSKVINNKASVIAQKQKQQILKNKSIRINSKKAIHQNTIQYKEYGKFRNKKLITISQVNGVLADKYHISLLPIQRMAYKVGKKSDVETQTQRQDKMAIRVYKQFQIQEKGGLAGFLGYFTEDYNGDEEASSVASTFMLKNNQKSSQPKKHAQIVAEIERGSRHMNYKSEAEKDLVNRRKVPQIIIKEPVTKQKNPKKKDIFTQTLSTFKNLPTRENRFLNPIDTPTGQSYSMGNKDSDNEIRIAKMEKINREVLRIYSKKSTVIDLSIKPKIQKSSQKSQKQLSSQKKQLHFFQRY